MGPIAGIANLVSSLQVPLKPYSLVQMFFNHFRLWTCSQLGSYVSGICHILGSWSGQAEAGYKLCGSGVYTEELEQELLRHTAYRVMPQELSYFPCLPSYYVRKLANMSFVSNKLSFVPLI